MNLGAATREDANSPQQRSRPFRKNIASTARVSIQVRDSDQLLGLVDEAADSARHGGRRPSERHSAKTETSEHGARRNVGSRRSSHAIAVAERPREQMPERLRTR